ncbi:adenosylcobinamide-GDP ribazoletransferase [Flavobacterium oreochromis]|uniref:adenosylcobinamide-GDP ribazoletransferase n=1 Tax=Flavobacterium oreochromis TaxID=2906078 RepID=UPI00385E4AC9
MKKQLHIFFTAITFYTRIPCPKYIHHHSSYLNKATRYFPLVGWLVGIISFFTFIGSNYLFSSNIAVVFSLISGILTTGAFHEDGFADVCDGFGGGWTKERILKIMKDSSIGAYGVIGVILLLLAKYSILLEIMDKIPNFFSNQYLYIGLLFITYHSISRANAISLSFTLSYVREDELSKNKHIAKTFSYYEVIGVVFLGLLPLVSMSIIYSLLFLLIIPVLLLTRWYMGRYFVKWIGGYTGDCLGALEQISEIITLLSFLTICKFI